jgi:hypothetical protein
MRWQSEDQNEAETEAHFMDNFNMSSQLYGSQDWITKCLLLKAFHNIRVPHTSKAQKKV